jgi:hypothetical protein
MTVDTMSLIFSMQGLLLLGTFLVGFNNHERWLWSAFYICLPLFTIVFITSFISLFLKSTLPHRKQLRRFFIFNFITLILLAGFVYWGYGGTIGV